MVVLENNGKLIINLGYKVGCIIRPSTGPLINILELSLMRGALTITITDYGNVTFQSGDTTLKCKAEAISCGTEYSHRCDICEIITILEEVRK